MKSELEKFFDKVNKSLKWFNFVFLVVLLVLTVIEIPYAYNYIYGPFEISESELEEIITNDEKPERGEYYKDGLKFNFYIRNSAKHNDFLHTMRTEFDTYRSSRSVEAYIKVGYLNIGEEYVYTEVYSGKSSNIIPIELKYMPEHKENVSPYTNRNISEYVIMPRSFLEAISYILFFILSVSWLFEISILIYILIVKKDVFKQYVFWKMKNTEIFKAEAEKGIVEGDYFVAKSFLLKRKFFMVKVIYRNDELNKYDFKARETVPPQFAKINIFNKKSGW